MLKKICSFYNLKSRSKLYISQIFQKISKLSIFYKSKVVISPETERGKIHKGGRELQKREKSAKEGEKKLKRRGG